MSSFELAATALDHAAVFVFAASGALAAAERKHDIVTFAFFAALTGVGGGTLRDLLIAAPVFWIHQPAYLVTCGAAALTIWIFGGGRRREQLLIWLDALGLSAYAVIGAAKALSLGVAALPAVVMGVMTATVGGVLRDVVAQHPSVLLRREVYVTAAVAGAASFVALARLDLAVFPAGLAGFAIAFGVRAAAIRFRLSLPGFRSNSF